MRKIFALITFTLLFVVASFAQNFSQAEVDQIKVESCENVKIDASHDHYVFVVHDTVNDVKYTFKDFTLADPIPGGGLKTYLNDTLLNTVKIVPADPVITSTPEASVVGVKIPDL